MQTLIKLLVAAIVINAVARGGMAAWSYFQLKDAALQTVVFGAGQTTEQLAESIVQRAAELEVPLQAGGVEVVRQGMRTVATASYTQRVEFFPRYEYPVKFSFSVDGVAIQPATLKDITN